MTDTDTGWEPVTRDEARALVDAASWPERIPCTRCDGTGSVAGPQRIIHTRRGGMGADNYLTTILDEITTAVGGSVGQGLLGRVLMIRQADGSFVAVDL
jgi:hypothetical protein